MTVPSTPRRAGPYYGTGALVSYPFSFKTFDKNDLEIVVASADGAESVLVIDSTALVTLNADQDANPGGSLYFAVAGVASALPPAFSLVILGDLAYAQQANLPEGGNYRAASVEDGLDALSVQIQQLAEKMARALLFSATDAAGSSLPPAAARASRLLGFDDIGRLSLNVPSSGSAAALALALASSGDAVNGAGMVAFDPSRNYAANTIGWAQRQGAINIGWFDGADPTGASDMTAIMNAAALLGQALYLPAGTWAMNWAPTTQFVLTGAGSAATFITPFNTAEAAITARGIPPQWSYATEISNLCFKGVGRVGVGFTCGKTDPAQFSPGDQIINNMRFEGVRFLSLRVGAQFPFGNIGVAFRSCGWTDNYYGVYCLNNKFGALMHAGNKYFYDSQFDSNACGVYVHNTAMGFGGITYTNTIFEYNNLDAYYYSNADMTFQPTSYVNCWTEGSGVESTTLPVTVDTWVGTTRGTKTVPPYCVTIEGARSAVNFTNSSLSGIHLTATNSVVRCRDVRVESISGFGGQPCSIPAEDSHIIIDGASSTGGMGSVARMLITGSYKADLPEIGGSTYAGGRTILTAHRDAIGAGKNSANEVSLPNRTPTNMSGSWGIAGSLVSDGAIFQRCNEYVIPFTGAAGEYVQVIGTGITTTQGWYAATVDVKVVSGNPNFSIWDRGLNQLMSTVSVPLDNKWHTLAAIGYSPSPQTLFFDIGKNVAGSSTVRVSAYQCRRFDTEHEAQAFLASRVYKEPLIAQRFGNTPGIVANGSQINIPLGVPGAVPGDSVSISMDSDLLGAQLSAYVNAVSNIQIIIRNSSGGPINIGPVQFYIEVRKP